MQSAGYNNWLSIQADADIFHLEIIQPAAVLYKNFIQAADNAIMLLHNKYNDRPLYLSMSGGIDSEFVANILLKNKIPFCPVILKIDKFNELESWYAEYWCKQNNIQPTILTLTVDQYAEQVKRFHKELLLLNDPGQTPILYLYDYATQQNGYCIYAAGDINLDADRKEFFCYSLDFISDILDNGHPTSFFMYTPELALSYLYQFDITLPEQYNKLKFYQVTPRPKIDYLAVLNSQPQIKKIIEHYHWLTKVDNFSSKHWYGTKEELFTKLYQETIV